MKNLLLFVLIGFAQVVSAQTIMDIVSESEVHNVLQTALESSTVDDALSGDGTFTLFAPTDAAFVALPPGVADALLADDGEMLDNILLGHALGSIVLAEDITGDMATSTLSGEEVTFTVNDDGVFINEAQITMTNIEASNGVVHVIDMVLLPEPPFEGSTVYEIIQNSDDHTTLVTAIDEAGLGDALSQAGPFTVFAPTDQAFAVLGSDLDEILADEDLLNTILTYHVAEGALTSGDLESGQAITTLEGSDAVVSIFGSEEEPLIFIDEAKVVVADLIADNGVVHVIDVVLTPPPAFTVLDIINDSEDHTILAAALAASGLDVAVDGDGPYTVFAPNDEAFEALEDGVLDALLEDPTGDLVDILYTHVLGGAILSGDLSDGQQATAFSGETLTVTIDGDNIFINESQVIAADLEADNGVLHVVDAIILPSEEMEVGIENLSPSALILSPVPALDNLNINMADTDTNWDLAIYNMVGQQVKTSRVSSSASIDLSDMASGTYIIQLTSETQRVTKAFMRK